MAAPAPTPPSDESPGYARRLTFRTKGGTVELISSERVEMIPPAPDPQHDPESFRVELRDSDDATVFSSRINSPVEPEREVFSADPTQPMRYVVDPAKEDAFQVIVPDLPQASDLVLDAPQSMLGDATLAPGSTEVARVRLRPEADEPPPPAPKKGRKK
jgi:hypothetical protein